MRRFIEGAAIVAAVQLFIVVSAFAAPVDSAPSVTNPFVICSNQKYALCAEASCFVYNFVAYCQCDVKQEGKNNGYMVSTFSLPDNVTKGGSAAVYTCPGSANAGSGVSAPVAYGQCDGAICFNSSRGQRFPGFEARLRPNENICSC